MRLIFRILSVAMLIAGLASLLATAVLYVDEVNRARHLEQLTAEENQVPIEEPTVAEEPTVITATSTATPAPWRPSGIRIPKIKVDSSVVEAPLENGKWQVPRFAVGHLAGTAYPGEIGNVALTGHLDGRDNSNVFARLNELAIGDTVTLFNADNETTYTVREVKVVKFDDLSVIAGTPEPVLTLITCTGWWNPFTNNYSERFIVVAAPNR